MRENIILEIFRYIIKTRIHISSAACCNLAIVVTIRERLAKVNKKKIWLGNYIDNFKIIAILLTVLNGYTKFTHTLLYKNIQQLWKWNYVDINAIEILLASLIAAWIVTHPGSSVVAIIVLHQADTLVLTHVTHE